MYDNRGKKAGAAVALICLIGMLTERFHGFIIFKKLDVEQHFGVFEWGLLFGLFLIAFSREKYDDERAKAADGELERVGCRAFFERRPASEAWFTRASAGPAL